MCNLYANTADQNAMRQLFRVDHADDRLGNAPMRDAIFPKGAAPVVRINEEGRRELVEMDWGFLIPQVSKRTGEPIKPRAVNNARDDKIRTSPFWRASFEERRSLTPATSYCETKGRNPATYHWFGVGTASAPEPFAFASFWRGHDKGEWAGVRAHTIVTTAANDFTRSVHPDRSPVILLERDYDQWLHGTPDEAFALVKPFDPSAMFILGSGKGMSAEPGEYNRRDITAGRPSNR